MPLLGRQSREVLPPIKNPAFSLTEENDVTITENQLQEATRLQGKPSGKTQKSGRFSGFGNPFKRKPSPSSSASSLSSPPESSSSIKAVSPAVGTLANFKTTTIQDQGMKQISVDDSQKRLIADNRKSPLCNDFEGKHKKESNSGFVERKAPSTPHTRVNNDVIESPRITSIDGLREIIMNGVAEDNYSEVEKYLASTFASFVAINETFKAKTPDHIHDTYDPQIDFEYYEYVCDSISHLPKDVQKSALRSVINCLLKDSRRNGSLDDAKALMILLMAKPRIYRNLNIYNLCSSPEANFNNDRKRADSSNALVQKFISERLFPSCVKDLPPVEKCRWWIQSAVKVLALLNSACWMLHPPLHCHKVFYCNNLDRMDLMREYDTWQRQTGKFSFCQYPFLLSLASKRFIMQKDSEMKMLNEARESIVKHVKRRQAPNMGMLFFNLKVRRSHLVSDSLNEIASKKKDLKKKLRVSFAGEPGLDLGGLTKEWFLLLIRRIFREEYGMFTYNSKSNNWWFNSASTETDHEFNLLGVLMGLAVYNSINLDIRLPLCCYKKLLSPAVVPYQNPHASVGMAQLGLNDLNDVNPELCSGLKQLLEYDGDVENDLCQIFQISYTSFGHIVTKDLKRNGSQIPVTNQNREEYVKLYVNYLLNKSIYKQFYAFYHGFHSVCASNALILLRPEEVEMLVCGNPDFDISALQQVTIYDGYTKHDPVVRRFWEVVTGFNLSLKKKMLLFTTGSDRVPVGGMSEMQFKITRMAGVNTDQMLPMAHTCFNQLILPPYKSKKTLNKKLTIAISNSEGFGIE
eukprot:gene5513-6198_t